MPAVMQKIDEMDVSQKVQVMDYLWSSLEAAAGAYTPCVRAVSETPCFQGLGEQKCPKKP